MHFRYTLSNITQAAQAGKEAVAEASSRDLLSQPHSFELFTINPSRKCKPYRYAYGTSMQVDFMQPCNSVCCTSLVPH